MWATTTARDLLIDELPHRWAHSAGVAGRSVGLRSLLGGNAELIEAASWVHDVGYAAPLVVSGFHPLDGAVYLRDMAGADGLLCRLVAYHTCADIEADERGLLKELRQEFEPPPADLLRALTYCDLTTGPSGRHVSVDERLAEIHARYGEEHLVSRSIRRATPILLEAVRSIEGQLAEEAVTE
ncbi:HD domain-containing protein [Kribbella yunnanensis]|uniref:HD domain-containing protein n=2 Tax=Kribbella yunnanensis TaxID=190194 RepID=A0ABN2IT79_9ACTN